MSSHHITAAVVYHVLPTKPQLLIWFYGLQTNRICNQETRIAEVLLQLNSYCVPSLVNVWLWVPLNVNWLPTFEGSNLQNFLVRRQEKFWIAKWKRNCNFTVFSIQTLVPPITVVFFCNVIGLFTPLQMFDYASLWYSFYSSYVVGRNLK